ncbi:hypothetical protein PV08_00474 [Exophiala spinifera]|uniref:Uncharacterized protein n=1 Tax=Exophiala spinifera TaxID=91928 RepID=A0A0D2C8M8_9EURO|nr:uncharacterized protein PV08_00474 [Exophiala spinifera]KIW19899.1 hypothetical protein PV08_00474 [Exophiala spinifera]
MPVPLHIPATASVWALSDTADKTVTMTRGLLEAMTSDDISPAALLTCGSFGSLLPVSPETRLKVEQLARRNHTCHALNFIKAQIGYKKDDSVEQLSRSDSGIRFLCLVATLCTLDHYDAADRLDSLLEATQRGFQIRPTIKQLQIMLNSMRTKMILSDFATSVAGFETMLRASLEGQGPLYYIGIAQIPTKESLQELVIAMNQLGRIADEDSIETIDVRLNSCYAPWTCAFIKWLLGAPPLVRTAQGRTLLRQEQASVTLTILSRLPGSNPHKSTGDGKSRIEVVPVQKLRCLRDIIFLEPTSEPRYAWQGLVSAQDWVDYQFSILYDKFPRLRKQGKLRKALGQALYFIVAKVPGRLVLCHDFDDFKHGISYYDGYVEDLFHPTAPKAFLNSEVRVRITNELVKGHITLVQDNNDESGALLPINLAQTLEAGCRKCQNPINGIIIQHPPCAVYDLLEWVGEVGSTLLTLTLFGPHREAFPMLKAGQMMNSASTTFHHRIFQPGRKQAIWSASFSELIMNGWQALMHGRCAYLSCPPMAIFQHAAKMMGHQNVSDSTVISSLWGQVLFPVFFEAPEFLSEGFLQMSAFPGKLRRGDMQFDFLLDSWSNRISTEGPSGAETMIVDFDLDLEGQSHEHVGRRRGCNRGGDDDDDDDDDEQMMDEAGLDPLEREEEVEDGDEISTEGPSDAETKVVDLDLDLDGQGHNHVNRSRGGSTGGDGADEQMVDEVGLDTPDDDDEFEDDDDDDDYDDKRDSADNGTENHRRDYAPPSTTDVNSGCTAGRPPVGMVPASFAGARRRRLVMSAEVMKWTISIRDAMLHGELRLQEDDDDGEMMIAWSLVGSLARARLSPICTHPYNNPAGPLAASFELVRDIDRLHGHGWRRRSLIVVGQSYAAQLKALQFQDIYRPVVVHVDGCIQCAMRLGLADRVGVVIS